MSSIFYPTPQARDLVTGKRVLRNTATLPATGAQSIFTITGGLVYVTALFGKVTTALGATATTISMQFAPTSGTTGTTVLGTATTVTSAEAGSLILPNVGGAVVLKNAGVPYPIGQGISATTGSGFFMLNPGVVSYTTSATDTGSIQWYLSYLAWDDGAAVVAA